SRRRRVPHSYASMIAQAILSSKEQRMTLRDIYKWVQAHHGTHYDASVVGWQNSIRHNLSLNRCFYKVPKNKEKRKGKGGYW
ncbi:fork head domain-containing protein, partial [Gongronella butleri]